MPLQNRVMPNGEIVAITQKGHWMGNRGGKIHDPHAKTLKHSRWASKRWIICKLEFKGRRRSVMGNSYTELFFKDEASALAGGHRPCFECRREDANHFANVWEASFGKLEGSRADAMDKVLHRERLSQKPLIKKDALGNYPDGTMFHGAGKFFIRKETALVEWTWDRTKVAEAMPEALMVLTPSSIIEVLRNGYRFGHS